MCIVLWRCGKGFIDFFENERYIEDNFIYWEVILRVLFIN